MSRRRRRSHGLGQAESQALATQGEKPHSLLLGLPIGVGACYLAARYTQPLTDEQIIALHRPVKPALFGVAAGLLMLASKKWRKAGVGTLLGTAAYYGYQVTRTPEPVALPPIYTRMV